MKLFIKKPQRLVLKQLSHDVDPPRDGSGLRGAGYEPRKVAAEKPVEKFVSVRVKKRCRDPQRSGYQYEKLLLLSCNRRLEKHSHGERGNHDHAEDESAVQVAPERHHEDQQQNPGHSAARTPETIENGYKGKAQKYREGLGPFKRVLHAEGHKQNRNRHQRKRPQGAQAPSQGQKVDYQKGQQYHKAAEDY